MIFGPISFTLNSVLVSNLVQNLKNRTRLKSHEDTLTPPTTLSSLTLAIAARNQEEKILPFISTLTKQSSLPTKTVFLVEKNLEEFTQNAELFKLKHPSTSLEFLQAAPLHKKYTQKNWDYKQLLEACQTDFILYIDPSVELTHSRALFSLFEESFRLREGAYSFASVLPRAKNSSINAIFINHLLAQLFYLLPPNWQKSSKKKVTAASSQIMFINALKLKEYKIFEKESANEDEMILAKAFRQKESFICLIDGGAFFSSEYYSNLWNTLKAFGNGPQHTAGFALHPLVVSAILFWAFVLPFILLPFVLINPWLLAALLTLIWGQYRLAQELNLEPYFIACTPVTASLAALIHLWSALNQQKLLSVLRT